MSTVQQAAEMLMGTADKSWEQVFEELGIPETTENCTELDGLVFQCAECGWWCEAGEANENPDGDGDLCDDCAPEEDD